MSQTIGLDFLLEQLDQETPAGYFAGLHIRFAGPLVQYHTYDQKWIDYYTENGFALRDPMVAWGFAKEGATRWSAIKLPDLFGIFKKAAGYGLIYGVVVSCGKLSSRSIVGCARADREFTDEEIERITRLVRAIHEATDPPESLTDAQKEALQLIADGHRHAAAAAKLGISESALKARLNSARNRLMARTTAEAIQRAKDYRLL
ncbi:MAG: autoinducer binding domain-containing protein [Rhodobacteraceae bacterium]|nr:autoinducer binding domain-containing protein [Paracoccaceae bacterium]